MNALRLLLTRPQPDAEVTAATLRARGHDVLVAPLLRFEPITDADIGPGPWAGLLMTSANAARAAARHARVEELIRLPVVAVGAHTADAARAAGFERVRSAEGSARELAAAAAEQFAGTAAPLLYLAASDRAADLAGALAAHNIKVSTVVVYRMNAADALPDNVAAALSSRRIDAVLHYSRRSAQVYLACAHAAGLQAVALPPVHYCLSAAIAEPLSEAGTATLRIAARPDEPTLLALIDSV